MAASPKSETLRFLRGIAGDDAGQTDADLVGRFVDHRDEAAFALLVRRHGAMVWGVCRRGLATDQDADDAFQATFLVLAEKARSVSPRSAVGNWLYGVARRVALLAARSAARRRERARCVPEFVAPEPDPLTGLLRALDDEITRLPPAYRTVVVLCDLEGRTRREAALALGWPEGTVAGRLSRARALLAKRLARHAPAVSVAAVLAGSASAQVPDVLAARATAPAAVSALTRDVLGVMAQGKLMKTAAVVFLVACAGFGMALSARQPAVPKSPPGAAEPPMNPLKAEVVAWGKEVGGLQAGLEVKERRAYRHGETVTLRVRVRNVGKEAVKFEYIRQYLDENPPGVTGADGKSMPQATSGVLGVMHVPVEVSLDPGKEIVLGTRIHGTSGVPYELRPADGGGTPATRDHPLRVGTGKVILQYERVFGNTSIGRLKLDPTIAGLATGKLELVVTADDAPAAPGAGVRPGLTVHLSKSAPWPGRSRCAFLDNDRILVHAGPGSGDVVGVHRGLQVRDAKTGKLLRSVGVERQFVSDFRVSADRKWVAAVTTADTTGTFTVPSPGVTVWDAATWKVRGTIDGHALLDLADDGRTLLVREDDGWGTEGGKVEVWDVVGRKRLRAAPFEFKRIDAARFSPDGALVAVSGLNEVAYWKWRDGDGYDRLGVGRTVVELAFSPDGKLVAEGPGPRLTIEVRDVATLKVAHTLSDPAQPRVSLLTTGMTFADSGRTLVLGNGVGLIESIPVPHRIHCWDVRTGRLIRQIDMKGGAPYSLDVSQDGKTLAAMTADDGVSLRTWDLDRIDGAALQ